MVALRQEGDSMRRSRSQSKRSSPMGTGRRGEGDSDSDDDHHQRRGPTSILNLHQVEHETNRPDENMIFGGVDAHSVTSSQARSRAGIDGTSSRGRNRTPSSTNRPSAGQKKRVSPTSRSPHSPSQHQDDMQLPNIEFTVGKEFQELQDEKDREAKEIEEAKRRSRRPRSAAGVSMTSSEKRKESLRTDVNKKAKFMPIPKGNFRKEFSLDHPLAPNGKGKYSKELRQGLQPLNMDLPKDPKASNVQETLQLAEKVEKLTYDAQQKVVDSDEGVKKMQDEMAQKLANVIEEERFAEETRNEAIRNIHDPEERSRLDLIFAEERARASERIIAATKEHDQAVRRALLRTMNLGN